MKANSTFKLSKQAKRILALGRWKDKDQQDAWRRAMIQAELSAAVPSRAPRQKDNTRG
jgi:hypothetical protein